MTTSASLPMKVRDGKIVQVPAPGFGTFTMRDPGDHPDVIARAIKAGYRHLDCAWEYGVSNLVGEGIKLSGVPREDLFLVSKFSPQFAAPENVEVGLDMELEALGTDYLDLFLAHLPIAFQTTGDITKAVMHGEASFEDRSILVDAQSNFMPDLTHSPRRIAALNGARGSFLPTWHAMQDLVRKGKVRAIGVSNFEVDDLAELLSDPATAEIPVSCNQIETQPWFPNDELLQYMHAHSILAVSYSPLATIRESYIDGVYGSVLCQPDGVSLINEAVVKAVASDLGVSPGQVLHGYVARQGVISLGRTYTDARMRENLAVPWIPDEQMQRLSKLKMEGTRGKSFILTLCFPRIEFGDMPPEETKETKKGVTVGTVEVPVQEQTQSVLGKGVAAH